MAWIESHQSLSRHKKTLRAVALLGVDRHKLLGHLHELWWWGLNNVPLDGSLGDLSDGEIAEAAEWDSDAEKFVQVLTQVGFIDVKRNSRKLHDWYDYAGKYLAKKADNAARMRNARAEHVQRTNNARAGATVPTVPNQQYQPVSSTKRLRPIKDFERPEWLTVLETAWGEFGDKAWCEEIAKDFPMVDLVGEAKACRDWWADGRAGKPKARKAAYRNRLKNAVRYAAERVQAGGMPPGGGRTQEVGFDRDKQARDSEAARQLRVRRNGMVPAAHPETTDSAGTSDTPGEVQAGRNDGAAGG